MITSSSSCSLAIRWACLTPTSTDSPGPHDHGLALDQAGGGAAHHDPVLGAVLVGLVGQPVVRVHHDPLHLVAVALLDDVPGAPRTLLVVDPWCRRPRVVSPVTSTTLTRAR